MLKKEEKMRKKEIFQIFFGKCFENMVKKIHLFFPKIKKIVKKWVKKRGSLQKSQKSLKKRDVKKEDGCKRSI